MGIVSWVSCAAWRGRLLPWRTGNVLAVGSEVSTRDLMARMGHDSMRAALIYQHASREADRSIADHLDAALGAIDDDDEDDEDDGGTAGVPVPVG